MLEEPRAQGLARRLISHRPGPLDGTGGWECEMSKVAILIHRPQNDPTPQGRIVAISFHREVIGHEPGSRNSLDGSDGIYRIPSYRPRAADFQQPLNYGRPPRSFDRIFACYHVHFPREAATETRLRRIFHGANLPELGKIP